MAGIPSEEEVIGYFNSLSNWGRWGEDDQRGTLNFIGPDKAKRAVQLVREGVTISCARTIDYDPAADIPFPPLRHMVESGEGWTDLADSRPGSLFASEFLGMVFHGNSMTHLDSLGHCFRDGKMYNGRSARLISNQLGATVESVELAKDSIVSRGVLVDVPMLRDINWVEHGEGVMPEDIEAAESRCGFRVEEGDVLLVRTGELRRRQVEGPVKPETAGSTACQAACLPFFHERRIGVIGSDTINDVLPSPYPRVSFPIHQVGIVAMGLWLLDSTNLEELSQACQQRSRWEFLICISPLRLSNATGSPINPVAIF